MSKEKSPAFQFYPRDWLSDPNVSCLSYEQEGWYIHLICHCWLEGRIPADPNKVARLLGIRQNDIDGVEECDLLSKLNKRNDDIAELLSLCFVPEAQLEGELEFMVHPRVEKERLCQQARRSERSESGKKGGKSSAIKRIKNPSSAWKQLQANSTSSSSSSSSSSSIKDLNTSSELKKEDVFMDIPTNITGKPFSVTKAFVDSMKPLFPSIDVEQEIRLMAAWAIANPRKRKTSRGMTRFINSWLSKAQDRFHNDKTPECIARPVDASEVPGAIIDYEEITYH